MFVDKYKKDKNNIFISTKEIDINKNNKIYFYILPINEIPFIKSVKDKCGILFYDQYPLYKIIFIQKNNYYDNINNPNTTRLVGRNSTLIISTCSIENFPYSSIVKREMTKCCITTYYNLIYGCLIYNIVLFNKYDLSE